MKSALWLTIEVAPGTRIEDACEDAVKLADTLGVIVWFKFNSVKCGARPGDDASLLADNWQRAMNSKTSFKIACANLIEEEIA